MATPYTCLGGQLHPLREMEPTYTQLHHPGRKETVAGPCFLLSLVGPAWAQAALVWARVLHCYGDMLGRHKSGQAEPLKVAASAPSEASEPCGPRLRAGSPHTWPSLVLGSSTSGLPPSSTSQASLIQEHIFRSPHTPIRVPIFREV